MVDVVHSLAQLRAHFSDFYGDRGCLWCVNAERLSYQIREFQDSYQGRGWYFSARVRFSDSLRVSVELISLSSQQMGGFGVLVHCGPQVFHQE